MSRFFSARFAALTPYTPGEQPQGQTFIKLNTNESPFPPSPGTIKAASREAERLQLYSDPDCRALTAALAGRYGVSQDQILVTNGSDDILYYAFTAFGDADHSFVFPDITYGFYSVYAKLNGIPFREIPLRADFTIDPQDYCRAAGSVVIANPNAPTGICLSVSEIEKIVCSNPDRLVLIDEAYIDFGGESALPLVNRYDNLLVTRTFSKSRSLAGARLGFGIGSKAIISDLKTLKFSMNPYSVNRMTMAAGIAALQEDAYYTANCQKIITTREAVRLELSKRGFTVLDSSANFLFAKSGRISGKQLYLQLKEQGILVRHFELPRISDFVRITIGTDEQMSLLLDAIDSIFREESK